MGVVNKVQRVLQPVVETKLSTVGKRTVKYTDYFKAESVVPNTIFYETREGQSVTDSPLAMFEYLLKEDLDKTYTHIWCVKTKVDQAFYQKKYESYGHVLFVIHNSDEYLRWLAKSHYLINNATFQPFVAIKEEQIYINTWHGTPLKTMGFDIPGNPANAKNVIRNFFMADFLLSSNEHMTKMYLDSFRLRHNYQGVILEGGSPRVDQTLSKNHDDTIKQLHDQGVKLDLSKQTILYSPTWKGGSQAYSDYEFKQLMADTSQIRQEFGDTYNVLVKVHPFVYRKAIKYEALLPYLVPDEVDTNKLLGLVDVLITDYSSIFFDFLVTGKPILFYCWDDDLYSRDRGYYFTFDELPGPVAYTRYELLDYLRNLEQAISQTQWNYERFVRLYVPNEAGVTTQAYVKAIFFNQESEVIKRVIQNKEKQSLLIYPGGLRKNGITGSFLNLISMIDYEKYNVTCLLDELETEDQVQSFQDIPNNVTCLFRFGLPLYTTKESYTDLYYHMRGVAPSKRDKFPMAIYQREVTRLLGQAVFGTSIDFSGYSLYWTKLILATQAHKKICYMHSDMLEDMNRVVNGKKIHKMNVKGIMSVYYQYDVLLSVSDVLMESNREKLSQDLDPSQFAYAENLLNPSKLLDKPVEVVEASSAQKEQLFRRATLLNPSDQITMMNASPDTPGVISFSHVFTDADLLVLGSCQFKGERMIKVSQGTCYLGWISEDMVEYLPDEVVSEETISVFGKFKPHQDIPIFNHPLGLASSQQIGSSREFSDLYVLSTKKVETLGRTSYNIFYDKTTIGWVNEGSFLISNKLNPLGTGIKRPIISSLRFITSLGHKKEKAALKRVSQVTSVYDDYVLLTQDVLAYTEMSLTSKSQPLKANELIYLEATYQIEGVSWYKIRHDSNTLYVSVDSPFYTTDFAPQVIDLREVANQCEVIPHEVIIYSTLDQVSASDGMLVKSQTPVTLTRRATLSNKHTFVEAQWGSNLVWLSESDVHSDTKQGVMNKEGDYIPYPNPKVTNFVTVGRLSEEKNQTLLIEAFNLYHQYDALAHLYIIGDGIERKRLEDLVRYLGLVDYVTLTGQINHPYPFVKRCDTFVLTSKYEGQPMVLLEALTLGVQVVSTDIIASRKVLKDGQLGILAKENTPQGVYEAMKKSMEVKNKVVDFSIHDYNEEVLERFESVIDN